MSTIRNADKIVVLKDGVVVEEGPHEKLMMVEGFYHSLVTKQLTTQEKEADLEDDKNNVLEEEDEIIGEGKIIEATIQRTIGFYE